MFEELWDCMHSDMISHARGGIYVSVLLSSKILIIQQFISHASSVYSDNIHTTSTQKLSQYLHWQTLPPWTFGNLIILADTCLEIWQHVFRYCNVAIWYIFSRNTKSGCRYGYKQSKEIRNQDDVIFDRYIGDLPDPVMFAISSWPSVSKSMDTDINT